MTPRWLEWLLPKGRGHGIDELARRLGVEPSRLIAIEPRYRELSLPKRGGRGQRRILAPDGELKAVQRRILRRLLARLRAHPCATGFERGESIVTNAVRHARQAVVVRMDVVDFFASTSADRIEKYFRRIGWNRPATRLLLRLCTWEGGLPAGAPTSPRLSNLVNYRIDARLAAIAENFGATYTRYADDITFSFADDDRGKVHAVRHLAASVLAENGYRVHRRQKAHVRRRHQRQLITGLVVNQRPALPRETRRWLRAVEHRSRREDQPLAKQPTLSESQLQGWRSLCRMIERPALD